MSLRFNRVSIHRTGLSALHPCPLRSFGTDFVLDSVVETSPPNDEEEESWRLPETPEPARSTFKNRASPAQSHGVKQSQQLVLSLGPGGARARAWSWTCGSISSRLLLSLLLIRRQLDWRKKSRKLVPSCAISGCPAGPYYAQMDFNIVGLIFCAPFR